MYLCQYFFVFIFIFLIPFCICLFECVNLTVYGRPAALLPGFCGYDLCRGGSSDHRSIHSTIYFYRWLGFSSFVRPWWVGLVRLISSREFNHSHRFNLFLFVRPVSVRSLVLIISRGSPRAKITHPRRGIYKPGAAARESGKYPQDIKRIQKCIDIQKCICYTTITRRS